MTTPAEDQGQAQTETPGINLQTQAAKATVAEITAQNAELEDTAQSAEAQAEATAEQASQLDQVLEEVVEDLQEQKAAAERA
jgi:hypothetical protein